ncbi:bifunctional aspartate kinase/diaminopimelate decarboxylase [Metallibacterium scheffleri]|uniref:bifunctional aspartate kinase/diaminopimelate decarboxylase n=1 Tax=Metallibacterium scheffleri TaxID=993689 RepID=UPI0026EEED3F|nr:bifunctional aspartate kinase/diaminopimelate decarboxylase [Metallibacterium scheffleri]
MSEAQPLPESAPWIVLKFGGTSVSTAARWATIRDLARARRAQGARVLVVVSALAGMTDALKSLCAEPDVAPRLLAWTRIEARHAALAAELGLPDTAAWHAQLQSLHALLTAGADAHDALRWQAAVMAHGELLSSALGADYLHAHWLDARGALLAHAQPNQSERVQRLSATLDTAPDAAVSAALARHGEVLITQGFIARDEVGDTVLLGRGGSDTSAAHFGALLRAARVEIWTDVAGMFSANPRQVPDARLLRRLDYEEAQEIATTGAKVLHARCLAPLRAPRVPLWIKDTEHPDLAGTVIDAESVSASPSVKALSMRKAITLVSMESIGMWQQVGFLADVFAQFKHHGLSVDLIGSAETNVTVSLDATENLLDSDALAALAADLARVCRVKVIAPCAAVTLVGRGMRSMLHRLEGLLAELGGERVHLISQSSNNLNLTFVVDEAVADALLPRLHALLLQAGALRADDAALFGPSWQALYASAVVAASPPWWRGARARLLDAAARGTPRYVYHLPSVRAHAQALRALGAVDRWYYALKANPHPALLVALAAAGFGLECVSPGELDAARSHAPQAPRLFTPNFAPRADYAAALAAGELVTLDALHPLQHWGELFAAREIGLRVDLGSGVGHHEKVRTGGSASKFGLPLGDIAAFLALAQRQGARVVVLHAHLGSGVLDAAHWPRVYAQLASLAERIGTLRALNIGGGLGLPQRAGEQPLDLAALDAGLLEIKRAYPQYELWMEPGRYLVAEAGVLLARVTQIKSKDARLYLGVDAGMHTLLRPALYGAHHGIVNLTRAEAAADTLYQVVGPICESGDVLGSDRRLPAAQEGDVMLIEHAGAYGAAMASNYNLRGLPLEEVLE